MHGAGIGHPCPREVRMQVKVRIFSSNARSMGDICSEAADFASTNQPQKAGPPECLDRCSWKSSRLIYLRGGRGDDVRDNLVKGLLVRVRC